MSKVTSEDCVRWIVENVVPTSKPADWKRVDKRKAGLDVVRTFENRITGKKVEVRESQVSGGTSVVAPRTFRGTLTKKELAGALAYALATSIGVNPRKDLRSYCDDPMKFLKDNFCGAQGLISDVTEDLKAVQFDEENFEWEAGEGYSGGTTGFHTLPNGLTFLGITAGGDWESPLFYIIYWDGDKLRAYVPTDGNHWNTDTNTAYGSESEALDGEEDEEKAAEENVKKRFGVNNVEDLGDLDMVAILADIQRNIVPACAAWTQPNGMEDIGPKLYEMSKQRVAPPPYVKPPETMAGTKVIVMGDKVQSGAMKDGTFAERFADVRKEAETFLAELDELSKMNLDDGVKRKAEDMLNGSLRRLVAKYVQNVSMMKML